MALYEGRGLEIVRQEMNQGFRHIEKRLADEFHELRSSMHIIYSTAGGNLVNERRNTESSGFLHAILGSRKRASSGDLGTLEALEQELRELRSKEKLHHQERREWDYEKTILQKAADENATGLQQAKDRHAELEKRNYNLNRSLTESTQQIKALKTQYKASLLQIEAGQEQLAETAERNKRLEQRCEELENRREAAAKQIEHLTRLNRSQQEQKDRLKDVIVKSSSDSEPLDDSAVVSLFTDLREQIQRIVFKFYRVDMPLEITGYEARASDVQTILDFWEDRYTAGQRQNRLRWAIFEMLHDKILGIPCFGLDGHQPNGELEAGLVTFELLLSTMEPGHEQDISDWRRRTIKCASWLQQSSMNPRAGRVAHDIWNFMQPVQFRHKKEDLVNHLLKLCAAALKLALLWRGARDRYACVVPLRDSRFDEKEADAQDVEGPEHNDTACEYIAFPIFGSLVKYPQHGSDRLVLEKAHVVTKYTP